MQFPTSKSKNKCRYGVYLCEECKTEYRMQVQDAKRCKEKCNKCLKRTHGQSASKAYKRWASMKTRCTNPNHEGFKNYGGRGITVSEDFCDFDKYIKYVNSLPNNNKPGYTVDRIDNDGNYERGNLRWSSHSSQGLNRRTGKYLGVRKSGSKFRYARTLAGKYLSFGTYNTRDEALSVGKKKYEEYIQENINE